MSRAARTGEWMLLDRLSSPDAMYMYISFSVRRSLAEKVELIPLKAFLIACSLTFLVSRLHGIGVGPASLFLAC